MSTASRRTRRHPTPAAPSPKILHFPRRSRSRRKQPKLTTHNHHHHNNPMQLHQQYLSQRFGSLENLLDQENEPPVVLLNSKTSSFFGRRERVEEDEEKELGEYNHGNGVFKEEKWRFQAEILRAECNFLRMEREFSLKKLERNKIKMGRTLRSAVQTFVSGRNKIFEGKSVNAVVEEEIEDLAVKLQEMQRISRVKDYNVKSCSNFDKKASILQRRLEKLGGLSDQSSMKESQELPEPNLSININRDNDKQSGVSNTRIENQSADMDMLKKKMEGLSKGTANSSVASSASTSKRIDRFSEFSLFSTRQLHQDQMLHDEQYKCSGRCKAIVRKIVEQVRAETEQWSQMQEMLAQVRGEMEELQTSRDYWENRAHNSDYEIQSLKHAVEEWKEKALSYESKANEFQLELSFMKEELQKPKEKLNPEQDKVISLPDLPPRKQLQKEKLLSSRHFKEYHQIHENTSNHNEPSENKDSPQITLGKQLAKEKRKLLRSLKENLLGSENDRKQEFVASRRIKLYAKSEGMNSMTRSPLRDIDNASPFDKTT